MSHRVASLTHNARLSNGTSLAAGVRAPALARGVIMRHLSGVLRSLDRYAARCVDLAPVIARIAVPRARSAPKDTGNQPRGVTQISSGAVPCHLQHHSFDRGGQHLHQLAPLFGHVAPEHAFQARVNLEQPLIEEHRRIIGNWRDDGEGLLNQRDLRVGQHGISQPPASANQCDVLPERG